MILYPDTQKELYFENDYKPLPNLDGLPLPELRELLANIETACGNALLSGAALLEMALYDDILEIKKAIKAATEKAVKTGDIIAIVYINCGKYPFIDWIIRRKKLFETRNKNTLSTFVGCRVLFAETGKGRKPLVRCSAIIDNVVKVESRKQWRQFRKSCCITPGSTFDFKADTRQKYLYHLTDVQPVPEPFTPPESVRHGRIWMEYTEAEG